MLSPNLKFDKLFLLPASAPPLFILWQIRSSGSLPDNDYWTYLSTILDAGGFTSHLNLWLSPSANEHIVLLPKMFYALNVWLSGGDNRMLGAFAFLFAAGQAGLLYRFAKRGFSREERPLALLTISIFVFTPRAVHNWMMGMSGVAWIGANLCAIAAFYLLLRHRPVSACLMATIGIFTYSTALAIWPAMVVGAWLSGQSWRKVAFILALGIFAIGLYLHQYHTPSHHPALQHDPATILKYVLIFVGGLSVNILPHAGWLGGVAIGIGGLLWLLTLKSEPPLRAAAAPWVMLQAYGLCNGVMAAIARSGFGLEQALSSRYASLPALFWLGLTFTAWLHLRSTPSFSRTSTPLIATCVLLLGAGAWTSSRPATLHFMHRSALKPLALVSLYTGAFDYPLLHKAVTPVVNGPRQRNTLEHFMAILKANGHVPFDGTFAACPEMGERIEPGATPLSDGRIRGGFDQARRLFPKTVKVHGWAYSRAGEIRCIALTNQDGIVRGIAIGGFPRPDVARHLRIEETASGWEGYARIQPGDLWLRAWARIGDTWHPLNRTLPVPPPARENSNSEVTHTE